MAFNSHYYPTYLNPFGEDEEGEENESSNIKKDPIEDYPDYLSPFGNEGADADINRETNGTVDEYDDSLNPFGDVVENDKNSTVVEGKKGDNNKINTSNDYPAQVNPFDDDDDEDQQEQEDHVEKKDETKEEQKCDLDNSGQQEANNDSKSKQMIEPTSNDLNSLPPNPNCNSETNSLEPPPVPLPRTKSLLKKRQQQLQQQQLASKNDPQHISSLSSTSSTSLSSLSTNNTTSNNNNSTMPAESVTNTGTFQKRKNKRIAPPVPVNFKRQVSGSLEAIEEELNVICDKLAKIDKESNIYQAKLKASLPVSEAKSNKNRCKIEELEKRKSSVIRRQKELMYRKREIKLDQIHSDIEYELRMIGNKQLSNRTLEDEAREKELLKKLVEIVEEKSDIVENLNKI